MLFSLTWQVPQKSSKCLGEASEPAPEGYIKGGSSGLESELAKLSKSECACLGNCRCMPCLLRLLSSLLPLLLLLIVIVILNKVCLVIDILEFSKVYGHYTPDLTNFLPFITGIYGGVGIGIETRLAIVFVPSWPWYWVFLHTFLLSVFMEMLESVSRRG